MDKTIPAKFMPKLWPSPMPLVEVESARDTKAKAKPPKPALVSAEGALYLADNLSLLAQTDSESVQLVYVDPPFFTQRPRTSKSRSNDAELKFEDSWESLAAYLGWLNARFLETWRVLAPAGSLVVHLDWRAASYVRTQLDIIFGPGVRGNAVVPGFRNEIVWHSESGGRGRKQMPRKHQTLLWYTKSKSWTFNFEALEQSRARCPSCGTGRDKWNHLKKHEDADGRVYRTIKSAGRVYRYYDDEAIPPADVWLDVGHLQQHDPERSGYPTQKPLALLDRIVKLFSNPGEVVCDLFCGSGTTLVSAKNLGRKFLGCDISEDAIEIAKSRLAR
ncbi:MAG: site-specific DNA-methyltransferase [Planctomycetes bacterium]|nr:site-specific DNA-methyltransferase [Planctomycetota bacterium]